MIDRPPCFAAIIGSEGTCGRDGDEDPLGVAWIQKDRVQTQATSAGLPSWPRAMAAQSGKLLPGTTTVNRTEHGSVFHSSVHGIRIGQRWLKMPDALELPGMRRAVV